MNFKYRKVNQNVCKLKGKRQNLEHKKGNWDWKYFQQFKDNLHIDYYRWQWFFHFYEYNKTKIQIQVIINNFKIKQEKQIR